MSDVSILAYLDKTVVKIKGLEIKGLNTCELEKVLFEKFKSPARVIGVTGNSIEMDIYGVEPEQILKDEEGIIKAVSTIEGINASEISNIESAEKIIEVDINEIPHFNNAGCAKERWLAFDKKCSDNTNGR